MTASPGFTASKIAAALRAGLSSRELNRAGGSYYAALAATYRANRSHYQDTVHRGLTAGDYRQAAEKSWGTYSQTIKTIGAEHGFHIDNHRSITNVSGQLTELVREVDASAAATLTNGLLVAHAMHIHWYENNLPDAAVITGTGTVAETVALLQALFSAEPAA